LFEDWVYWTDWIDGKLVRLNRFSGDGLTILEKQLDHPTDIVAVHRMKQQFGE